MEDVCEKLDDLVEQYFDKLEHLMEVRQRMHEAMRQGYFSLSKARNSLGNGQLGALQYDYSNMKAQKHVETVIPEGSSHHTFQLMSENATSVTDVESCGCQHVEELTSATKSSGVVEDERSKCPDPLRWFGILVPSALRHCQEHFLHAVTECSHLANLQNQLLAIRHQYLVVLHRKKQLQLDG